MYKPTSLRYDKPFLNLSIDLQTEYVWRARVGTIFHSRNLNKQVGWSGFICERRVKSILCVFLSCLWEFVGGFIFLLRVMGSDNEVQPQEERKHAE